jgi:signal transduction histidine kinase
MIKSIKGFLKDRRQGRSFFLIFIVGVIITTSLCLYIYYTDQVYEEHLFQSKAQMISGMLSVAFRDHVLITENVAGLYNASEDVTPDEFNTFAAPYLQGKFSIQALEWVPYVKGRDREKFVNEARKYFPGFEITVRQSQGVMKKAPQRKAYYPIYYIEPIQGNKMARGFDVSSEPVRRDAIIRAIETNKTTASGRITLVQEKEQNEYGFLVFTPVYKGKNMKGFALGVYRVGDIVRYVLQNVNTTRTIKIFDLSAEGKKSLIYSNTPALSGDDASFTQEIEKHRWHYSYRFDLAGRKWVICCTSDRDFFVSQPGALIAILSTFVLGFSFSFFLALFLWKKKKDEDEINQYNEHLENLVTERTEKLKMAMQKLMETEKMSVLGTFAAGTAHELNNPLMGALNFIQHGLKHVDKNGKCFEAFTDAENEIARCIKITKNLLAFSHKGEEIKEEAKEARIKDLFDRVLFLLNYRAREKNVEITTHFPENALSVFVQADKMQQVFLNLLTNAFDAMKDSKVKKVTITEEQKDNVEIITIEDTGAGIEPENRDKIFDIFFTTKSIGEGLGLGLSIVKQIVEERHGGKSSFESTVGKGTIFRIELPMKI